jgi:uncharacterized protein
MVWNLLEVHMRDTVVRFEEIDEYGPQHRRDEINLRVEELENVGPVTIDMTADEGDLTGEYRVKGTVTYSGDLRCARCVEPYPFANESNFTVRYRPRSEAPEEGREEVEIGPDDLEVEYYDEPLVSLRELAAEQIQLSLTMKPLCGEGCLGLCPRCGENLNRGACSCEELNAEGRWGALRTLRDQLAKKNEV